MGRDEKKKLSGEEDLALNTAEEFPRYYKMLTILHSVFY